MKFNVTYHDSLVRRISVPLVLSDPFLFGLYIYVGLLSQSPSPRLSIEFADYYSTQGTLLVDAVVMRSSQFPKCHITTPFRGHLVPCVLYFYQGTITRGACRST